MNLKIDLPNDLIVITNQGVDHGGHVGNKRVLERQGDTHTKVEIQSNLKFQSLILSPTQSSGPTCLQINVHDAYDFIF
jgi:hypothetical protein